MFKLKTKIQGFYKIEAFKKTKSGKEYGRRLVADWFPNLIVDAGMNRIATAAFYGMCRVGADNTAPTVADVNVGSLVAATSDYYDITNGVNSTSPYYVWYQFIYRFGEGVAAGNLSEVAVGNYSVSFYMFSRALILDTYGSPTTITVLSDEYLDVTYEFRYYPLETDVTGTMVFTGNIGGTYDYTLRQANILTRVLRSGAAGGITTIVGGRSQTDLPPNFSNKLAQYYPNSNIIRGYYGSIGAIDGWPSDLIGSLAHNEMGNEAYTPGSFILYCWMQANPDDWNHVSGVKSVAFTWGMRNYQMEFDTAIPKTATDVLRLRFSHEWARV